MAEPIDTNYASGSNGVDPDEESHILPPGIVSNSTQIYIEVATYDKVPADRLHEYWRVYTITHKKLCDPTSSRLESFWWHVWGSDRRNLSGPTLARLYEDISNGPTFTPLRGPTSSLIPALSTAGPTHVPSASEYNVPRDESEDDEGVASSSHARPPPVHSILRKSRPSFPGPRPTPHFALPSSEQSQNEAQANAKEPDNAVSENSSAGGSSENTKPDRPTNRPESSSRPSASRSGTQNPGARRPKTKLSKKFVATSSAAKRRPVIPKRTGSHSSTGSAGSDAVAARDSSLASRQSGQTLIEEEPELEEDFVPSVPPRHDGRPAPETKQLLAPFAALPAPATQRSTRGEKSAGKQRTISPRPLAHTGTQSPTSTSSAVSLSSSIGPASPTRPQRPTLVTQASRPTAVSPSLDSSAGSTMLEMPLVSKNRQPPLRLNSVSSSVAPRRQHSATRDMEQRTPRTPTGLGRGGVTLGYTPASTTRLPNLVGSPEVYTSPLPVRMSRSVSQESYAGQQSGDEGHTRSLLPGLGATAIAEPCMVAATGVLQAEGPDPFDVYAETVQDDTTSPGGISIGSSYSAEHITSQRPLFSPTRPSQTPRIPFARTRSQLNIILGREKERLGENNFATWQESRHRDHRRDDNGQGPAH